MNRTAFLFLGVAISASAFASFGAGCGNGTGGTGGTGSGGATASSTGTSKTTSSSTAGTGGGTGGVAGTGGSVAAKLDCASYCGEITTNCTTTNTQFTDMATCMGTCAGYPPGTLADTSGDTLGCRIYHAGAPAKADPITHCPHAGITGGDKDPNGTSGTCGEACDSFCNVALVVCAGQPLEYATKDACMTECKTFAVDTASYSTADSAKNDMGCRMYHLTAAAESASAAVTHCAHIHAVSPVCTM
jgi:hypothetical protein